MPPFPKLVSIEEATIAGEGLDSAEHGENAAASGEGDHHHHQQIPLHQRFKLSDDVDYSVPPSEISRVHRKDSSDKEKEKKDKKELPHSHKGHSMGDIRIKKTSSKGSQKTSSGHSGHSSSSSPIQILSKRSKNEDEPQVKFAAVAEGEDKEAAENPSDLPFKSSGGENRRVSRTKSDGAKNLSDSGNKLGLMVGKKVKKNTKTLLKKKSPKIDRSHRGSIGSTGSDGAPLSRERRHSLDAKPGGAPHSAKFEQVGLFLDLFLFFG